MGFGDDGGVVAPVASLDEADSARYDADAAGRGLSGGLPRSSPERFGYTQSQRSDGEDLENGYTREFGVG